MRKLFLLSVLVAGVAVLAGCPKKKADDADDAGDAEIAAPVAAEVDAEPPPAPTPAPPIAPTAKNVADVARFPAGEAALVDDEQKTVDHFVQARTGPKQGGVVARVKAGTDPFKIAEFQDSVLITFPDPKDATVTLMGWIPKDAFVVDVIRDAGPKDASKDAAVVALKDAAVPVVVTGVKCAAGQEAVDHIAATTVCRKRCKVDQDCKTKTPGACKTALTNKGKVTRVCAGEAP